MSAVVTRPRVVRGLVTLPVSCAVRDGSRLRSAGTLTDDTKVLSGLRGGAQEAVTQPLRLSLWPATSPCLLTPRPGDLLDDLVLDVSVSDNNATTAITERDRDLR
jgi:hypothetical protein